MEKYTQALEHLNSELAEQQLQGQRMTEEEQDFFLAEWLLDGYESGVGRAEYGWALAAVQKLFPRIRLKVAWKVFDTWGQLQPPRQAPAAPPELLQGMICAALLLHRPHLACLMVACYTGLLRVREGLNLKCNDVIILPDSVVLCLGQTKRGLGQKIVLTNSSVVSFFKEFFRRFPQKDVRGFVFPISYGSALRWIKKLADLLGASSLHLTTHTFRRSGASELSKQGMALADILLYGRWASERSARDYIRKGEVAIHRARADLNQLTWHRITRWADSLAHVWMIFDALYHQHQLTISMDRVTADKFEKFESLVFQLART